LPITPEAADAAGAAWRFAATAQNRPPIAIGSRRIIRIRHRDIGRRPLFASQGAAPKYVPLKYRVFSMICQERSLLEESLLPK
jgi:predicted pyridoxine 5'-phosphate oxidase superfamily flavin-nucleotide-binding protein